MISDIDEACASGARLDMACAIAGISPRTIQRYHRDDTVKSDGRKAAASLRIPANKITEEERSEILRVANSPQFENKPPSQIVPELADQGRYLASESSFYRILRAARQLAHRGRVKAPTHSKPDELVATAPDQLWSWDITYLPTTVKGIFFYLYLILDIYSRKIVGWEVFDEESAEHAAYTFKKAYMRQSIAGKPLILHSDNGSPMKGATMLGTLQRLGVMPSFSRPSVSNDNAYSESLFKTLKYSQGFPEKPFDTLTQARLWVSGFEHWYNEEHRHSAIQFVTPGQRHRGEDILILKKRMELYEAAKAHSPERWARQCRNWNHSATVSLNSKKSCKDRTEPEEIAA
jgi:transposase InsO family protein